MDFIKISSNLTYFRFYFKFKTQHFLGCMVKALNYRINLTSIGQY